MTFDEVVSEVMDRLNLSSSEATTRISKRVNARYKRATSSIGLVTTRFAQVQSNATIGNRIITFQGIEKILAVIDKSSGVDIPLSQITLDEMHITPIRDEPPRKFAVQRNHANTVDILLDLTPTTAFLLYADGQSNEATLVGAQQPDFPESFHDILVFGALADEYRKLEKFPLAKDMEGEYEKRLSDLRMWIAKSAALDIYAGRYTGKSFRWTHDPQTQWD